MSGRTKYFCFQNSVANFCVFFYSERSNLEVAIKEKLFLHLEHSHHKMVFTDQHGVCFLLLY